MKKVILFLFLVLFLVGCSYTVPKMCNYNGKVYQSGATWIAGDGCNSCGCTNGEIACTEMACESFVKEDKTPVVDKVVSNKIEYCVDGNMRYEIGDTWTAQDGCSYCICEDTGVSCSDKKCVLAPGTCNVREDCDDNDVSTDDFCIRGLCSNKLITKCMNRDGFCPVGCDYYNDDDCEVYVERCTDLDCFADYAEECRSAEGTNYYISEEGGIEISQEVFYRIGLSDNGCELYIKTNSVHLDVTNSYKSVLKSQGWSDNEIDQRIDELESERYGSKGSCITYSRDLMSLFRQWEDGYYSLNDDFNDFECSGDYFNPIIFS